MINEEKYPHKTYVDLDYLNREDFRRLVKKMQKDNTMRNRFEAYTPERCILFAFATEKEIPVFLEELKKMFERRLYKVEKNG